MVTCMMSVQPLLAKIWNIDMKAWKWLGEKVLISFSTLCEVQMVYSITSVWISVTDPTSVISSMNNLPLIEVFKMFLMKCLK